MGKLRVTVISLKQEEPRGEVADPPLKSRGSEERDELCLRAAAKRRRKALPGGGNCLCRGAAWGERSKKQRVYQGQGCARSAGNSAGFNLDFDTLKLLILPLPTVLLSLLLPSLSLCSASYG